jgi:GNAT superfamily N-acetyltransferase/DNA-binding PadR family transcriptional regulator
LRELRERLDLDSGYLTRLLAALQAEGLVTVKPSEQDRRVRVARLTPGGRAEWVALDQVSDEAASEVLSRLNSGQRERLLGAMAEVERLLSASMVVLERCDPEHPDAVHCLSTYYAELAQRFDAGFDPSRNRIDAPAMRPPAGLLLIARLYGTPVGCGALLLKPELAKIKRMWVDPSVRGLGLGHRLLAALEAEALAVGYATVGLETNSALGEAIGMYRANGYTEVEPFDDEPYAHHWFTKALRA